MSLGLLKILEQLTLVAILVMQFKLSLLCSRLMLGILPTQRLYVSLHMDCSFTTHLKIAF